MTLKTQHLLTAALIATSAPAMAQTQTGSDDFDGGGAGFVTRSFLPDNAGNTGFGGLPSPTFGGSFTDLFGIGGRDGGNNGLPFDALDDSAVVGSPVEGTDSTGLIRSGAEDPGNVFIMTDIANGNNPSGLAIAGWTFDTSANPNWNIHRVKVDAGMQGDFEASDSFVFTGSIGATNGASLLTFGMSPEQDDADIPYQVIMQSGIVYDRTPDQFFDPSNYAYLINNGPGTNPDTGEGVNYVSYDDGVDPRDNGIAQDGIVKEPTFTDPNALAQAYEETNNFGTFENAEFAAFSDPLFATDVNGNTIMDNRLQTWTSPTISDTGNTFTLDFLAANDGSGEYLAIDNIVLESAVLGDANGDGALTNGDIAPFVDALTGTDLPIDEAFVLDFNGDGAFTNGDIAGFVASLVGPAPTAIPEPSSLLLVGMLGGLGALRRRR